jgi:ABC-type iron transport system FetAB ATPase subunit
LDEATSALDTESEWAVKEAIDRLLRTSEGKGEKSHYVVFKIVQDVEM